MFKNLNACILGFGQNAFYMNFLGPETLKHRVHLRMFSVDTFFHIFEIINFCCVVAICDLVHDVETIFQLSYVLTASGNLF